MFRVILSGSPTARSLAADEGGRNRDRRAHHPPRRKQRPLESVRVTLRILQRKQRQTAPADPRPLPFPMTGLPSCPHRSRSSYARSIAASLCRSRSSRNSTTHPLVNRAADFSRAEARGVSGVCSSRRWPGGVDDAHPGLRAGVRLRRPRAGFLAPGVRSPHRERAPRRRREARRRPPHRERRVPRAERPHAAVQSRPHHDRAAPGGSVPHHARTRTSRTTPK